MADLPNPPAPRAQDRPSARPSPFGDELLPLPPLDDDGERQDALGTPFDDTDAGDDDETSLDDATGDWDPVEAWAFGEDTSLLEADARPFDDDDETMRDFVSEGAGAPASLGIDEHGWTEGSDDPPPLLTADEAGLFEDPAPPADDGGAEGIDDEIPLEVTEGPMDDHEPEDEEDVPPFPREALLSRRDLDADDPLPRADRAWILAPLAPARVLDALRAPTPLPCPAELLQSASIDGEGRAATYVRAGGWTAVLVPSVGVFVSSGAGGAFTRVDGCRTATAIAAIPGAPVGQVFVAALYDTRVDVASLAVLRADVHGGGVIAEIVADLPISTGDDPLETEAEADARVRGLEVAASDDGIEVLVFGSFGVHSFNSAKSAPRTRTEP